MSTKRTRPELTPVERARLIGERARQIEANAVTTLSKKQLKDLERSFPNLPAVAIATEELRLKIIPLKVVRVLGNGEEEVWKISEFLD